MPRPLPIAVCLTLLATSLCGCVKRSQDQLQQLQVSLDPQIGGPSGAVPSVEVDVVGLTAGELAQWQAASVDAYWQPGDRLRGSAAGSLVSLALSANDPGPRVVELTTQPAWQAWERKGATYLMVIGNLPDPVSPSTPQRDPRRVLLPLDADDWASGVMHISVLRNRLSVLTLPTSAPPELTKAAFSAYYSQK